MTGGKDHDGTVSCSFLSLVLSLQFDDAGRLTQEKYKASHINSKSKSFGFELYIAVPTKAGTCSCGMTIRLFPITTACRQPLPTA
jgi:hypothetical protein